MAAITSPNSYLASENKSGWVNLILIESYWKSNFKRTLYKQKITDYLYKENRLSIRKMDYLQKEKHKEYSSILKLR